MGTLWPENLCAHRKGAIEQLIKDQARDTAALLQILFAKPTGDHDGPEELLVKQFTSFTESLSQVSLSSCDDCECEVTQIPNGVGSPIGDQRSVNPSESCKRPAAEDRRGCYKRRKTSDIRMEVLSTANEDGQFPISYSLNNPSPNPLPEAHLRSFPSKTFSDSESHSCSFSSIAISTQYTSSCPSSAASVRKECWGESEEIVRSLESMSESLNLKMKNLKFLSVQGISQSHYCITMLSLRACSMLRNIPCEIGLLKSLAHFDMSKCYSLDHIPKEISNLLQLEVLKGFVVGNSMEKDKDSCTLEHLAKLTKLRILSIYTKGEDFPFISDVRDLNRLKKLHKLKIEWGGVSVHKSENITKVDNSSEESPAVESTKQENNASPELPPQLEELHLKCLPWTSAPDWLRASKLNKIKKLHIEGGPLSDLGQLALQEKCEWQVEILHLKFLKGLEMNWRDLRKLFPKLIYFEKVSCPKLQFFPCDEWGVWMEKPNKFF